MYVNHVVYVNRWDVLVVTMCDLLVIGVPFSVDIIGVDETLVVSVAAVVTDLMFVDASGSSCDVVVH